MKSLNIMVELKYGFCNKSFRKDETLTSWTLLQHICPHFWAWLLLYSAITPKSEDKYVVKVFNSTEFHFSEVYFFQNCYFSKGGVNLISHWGVSSVPPSWLSVTSSSSQCCWTRMASQMIECYQFRCHFAEPQKR